MAMKALLFILAVVGFLVAAVFLWMVLLGVMTLETFVVALVIIAVFILGIAVGIGLMVG